MRLSLELILEKMEDIRFPMVFMGGGDPPVFYESALFSKLSPPEDRERLYVGALEDLLAIGSEASKGYAFCLFGQLEDFTRVQQNYECTILYYEPDVDVAVFFNGLQRLFSRFQHWDNKMDNLLAKGASLQEMMDASELLFENPLYLWDAAFRIEAFTHSVKADHPLLKTYRETGRVPQHVLAQLARSRNGLMHNAERYTTMQMHYPPNFSNVPFALRIFKSGQKTALVLACYYVNTPPTTGRIEMLELFIAKIDRYVEIHFHKEHFKTLVYEPFIVELVEGSLHTEAEIRERLELVNLPYEMKYRIYYIAAPTYTSSLISYLRYNCKSYLPHAKVIPYQHGVLVLDQEGKENLETEQAQRNFASGRAALSKINAISGISSAFFDLGQVRTAYLQAMAAFALGPALHPGQSVYFYRDYYLYHVLDTFARFPEMNLEQLSFKRLDLLEQSDSKTNNDNLQLLEVYLQNNRNITNTAREMNLHRNSVIYRLERISELLRVPLDDPEVQLRLLISFKIRRLLKARKGELP